MSTYNPIATQTLTGATSLVIFSNIPQSYTDLVVVINGALSGSGVKSINFNLDTASNYSCTTMIGAGSSYSSGRYAEPYIDVSNASANSFVNVIQINNYSNNITFKNYLARQNAAVTSTETIVGLWRNTNPITTISFSASGGQTYASGTTFSIYAISAGSPKAQGGLVTKDSTYYYHTFLSSGVFTSYQALTVDYLVVAGGGGGGQNTGGGGGAGGYRTSLDSSTLSLTAQDYAVTVGSGGAGGYAYDDPSSTGSNGSNSSFSTITASGGGGGAGSGTTIMGLGGNSGGSGGGASRGAISQRNGGAGNSGSYSPVEGYAGGNNGTQGTSGGGGGAGAVGGNAGSSAGNGGAGRNTNSAWATATNTGVSGYYAGGGGGGSYDGPAGSGGAGGGGAGSRDNIAVPVNGVANTGGGGGGMNNNNNPPNGNRGANGGSGIVIVRYAI